MSTIGAESTVLAPEGIDWPGMAGCALVIAGFGLVGGVPGLLAGAIAVGTWVALGTPSAIAAGHVLMPAIVGGMPNPADLVLLEVGFVTLILGSVSQSPSPGRFLAVTVATIVALGAVLWGALTVWPLWAATVTIVAASVVATYLAHRASLVRLDLVAGVRP